jgi:hypothetical protein
MAAPNEIKNSSVSYMADGVTTTWNFSFADGYRPSWAEPVAHPTGSS